MVATKNLKMYTTGPEASTGRPHGSGHHPVCADRATEERSVLIGETSSHMRDT